MGERRERAAEQGKGDREDGSGREGVWEQGKGDRGYGSAREGDQRAAEQTTRMFRTFVFCHY